MKKSSRTEKAKPAAKEITVKGRVQRVGYRRYLLDIAQELGNALWKRVMRKELELRSSTRLGMGRPPSRQG